MKRNTKFFLISLLCIIAVSMVVIIGCPRPPEEAEEGITLRVKVVCNQTVTATRDIEVKIWYDATSGSYSGDSKHTSKFTSLTDNSGDVEFIDVVFPVYIHGWYDASGDNIEDPTNDNDLSADLNVTDDTTRDVTLTIN